MFFLTKKRLYKQFKIILKSLEGDQRCPRSILGLGGPFLHKTMQWPKIVHGSVVPKAIGMDT